LKLFREIKQSMRRCVSFSTSKTLLDLSATFKNVFNVYHNLLKQQVPSKQFDVSYESLKLGLPGSSPTLKSLPEKPMSDDVELKCVFIINTCEYCIEIIPQLQQSIENQIDEAYCDKVDLDGGCDIFRQLIRCCVNCLVVSLCTRND